MKGINGNGGVRHRSSAPDAPSSDSGLFVAPALRAKRRYNQPPVIKARNKAMHYHAFVATVMAAFVLFQIYFLHQLEKYHERDEEDSSEHIPWIQSNAKATVNRQQARAVGSSVRAKKPPMPKAQPPPKTTLLPKHVVTVFGPESSGTTFLSTTLGIAVGAWAPEGKWTFIPGNQWTIPGDDHQFTEKTRFLLETTLGRRAMSPDGNWEIQHLSLPWGWYCEEDRNIEIVEALVPEECWRYQEDSHVSPKAAEAIWYGKAKRARKKIEYYQNPDNFEDVEKIPIRMPQELKYIDLCKNEVHITQENESDESEWSCGAKCGSGAFDGFALYPKRFSVNITSHIEWYLSRGVEVTAILSARDRSISTKSKLQDHCKLDIGVEEDKVALDLMTEALERYGKRGSNGDRERALVVSYEGLMGVGKAHLFDLYRKLGINSTYVPVFKDGNNKYVAPIKKKPERQTPQKRYSNEGRPVFTTDETNAKPEDSSGDGDDKQEHRSEELEQKNINKPPAKPSMYQPPPPKEKLLPKRVIAVFGPESSGTTFLTSVLGVATGAFPAEGRWAQVLAPDPQESTDPSNPRKKWKFEHMIPERATTDDGALEVQHLSLPSGWVCQKQSALNQINVVDALVPAECIRYETLPDLFDLRLADQIWYNKHAAKPKKPALMTDTVEDFDWEETQELSKNLEKRYLEQCRSEVNISSVDGSCGAKCGEGQYDGFALYPNRYFVNITSHIEWYLARGVDITVVISMRDRSISRAAKRREHCRFDAAADKEDEMALLLINEAINKYGTRGDGDAERVITVSYEAMMEFRESYLFDLYHQLEIDSEYVPTFLDGNVKYVTNATKGELTGKYNRMTGPGRLTSGGQLTQKKRTPPADWKPRPPKKSVLPSKVITVVGPESSGTTLLATAFGVATGAFYPEGEWYQIFTYGRKGKLAVAPDNLDFSKDAVKKMDFKDAVNRRVNSADGVEIQHLSLPWGWTCDDANNVNVVEALVPDECFRYERAPNMDPHFAEGYFWSEHRKEVLRKKAQLSNKQQSGSHRRMSESIYFNEEDVLKLAKCRDEARISENNEEYSCGAMCGTGAYDGFALYPQRFSINITSHIEWYLARGVDITVVVSTRDATISHKGKLKSHCSSNTTAELENNVAFSLIEEALAKYGKRGSMLGPADKERVIAVNYEALMELQEPYLFNLYSELGINSTHALALKDGNVKYVVDAAKNRQENKIMQFKKQPKPVSLPPPPKHEFLLPKRLITVFSLDTSKFLSTSIAVAAGAFPEGSQWIQQNDHLVYEDTIKRSVRSRDGEVEVQHIMLPASLTICESETAPIVEALVPPECSVNTHGVDGDAVVPSLSDQCKDEVFISAENDSGGSKWSCGAECGSGDFDGFAIYPDSYFVNISSHIDWYTARGVDITVVLQTRDRSVSMKTMAEDENACRSRMIAAEEAKIGLKLMREAYERYGAGTSKHVKLNGRRKGAERVIVASYESLMKFKETYLLGIFEQLGINSEYVSQLKHGNVYYPLAFVDENAKYIRTPPDLKKTSAIKRPIREKSAASLRLPLNRRPLNQVENGGVLAKLFGRHRKESEENVRL